MKTIKVKSIDHLKELCLESQREGFISLFGGVVRSSKNIHYDGEIFEVYNYIDDTFEIHTDTTIEEESNISEAIEKGVFFIED